MITITIMGPTKSGKSFLASYLKTILNSLANSVVVFDNSPRPKGQETAPLYTVFRGTDIKIEVKSKAK